ncbi:hypothetical protein JYT83_01240 [bacterium AH-315-F18]|nr:hypothetical protein [bacterium AH-315-F18]
MKCSMTIVVSLCWVLLLSAAPALAASPTRLGVDDLIPLVTDHLTRGDRRSAELFLQALTERGHVAVRSNDLDLAQKRCGVNLAIGTAGILGRFRAIEVKDDHFKISYTKKRVLPMAQDGVVFAFLHTDKKISFDLENRGVQGHRFNNIRGMAISEKKGEKGDSRVFMNYASMAQHSPPPAAHTRSLTVFELTALLDHIAIHGRRTLLEDFLVATAALGDVSFTAQTKRLALEHSVTKLDGAAEAVFANMDLFKVQDGRFSVRYPADQHVLMEEGGVPFAWLHTKPTLSFHLEDRGRNGLRLNNVEGMSLSDSRRSRRGRVRHLTYDLNPTQRRVTAVVTAKVLWATLWRTRDGVLPSLRDLTPTTGINTRVASFNDTSSRP